MRAAVTQHKSENVFSLPVKEKVCFPLYEKTYLGFFFFFFPYEKKHLDSPLVKESKLRTLKAPYFHLHSWTSLNNFCFAELIFKGLVFSKCNFLWKCNLLEDWNLHRGKLPWDRKYLGVLLLLFLKRKAETFFPEGKDFFLFPQTFCPGSWNHFLQGWNLPWFWGYFALAEPQALKGLLDLPAPLQGWLGEADWEKINLVINKQLSFLLAVCTLFLRRSPDFYCVIGSDLNRVQTYKD